jgi:hypothetical protein
VFVALFEGRLSGPDAARLEQHAATCEACRALTGALTKAESEPGHALAAVLGEMMERGTSIGRTSSSP